MATLTMNMASPPTMPSSPNRQRSPTLSLDFSDLPPLSQPSPPSNTLIVTNLQAPEIFTRDNLSSVQRAINDQAELHSFAPLKSFRRIIVSFYNVEDAVKVRQVLDGETVLGHRVRVYFGQTTKIEVGDQHLQAPKSQKMFFISPPPSPPVGWEMRNEEPPNKDVHAEDLAAALSRLRAQPLADEEMNVDSVENTERTSPVVSGNRQRSSSTVLYDPQEHGHSPHLPAIALEDTSDSPGSLTPMEGVETRFAHTSRPPVELM